MAAAATVSKKLQMVSRNLARQQQQQAVLSVMQPTVRSAPISGLFQQGVCCRMRLLLRVC
jgi:hypothetical protein